MTKKEIADLERQQRIRFINGIYRKALTIIACATEGSRSSLQVRLTHKNGNRYISMSIYGSKLKLQIYRNGNIAIELSEFCHSDHQEVLFEYTDNIDAQFEFIEYMDTVFRFLIETFSGVGTIDSHVFMDYISWNNEIIPALDAIKKEWKIEEVELSEELVKLKQIVNQSLISPKNEK